MWKVGHVLRDILGYYNKRKVGRYTQSHVHVLIRFRDRVCNPETHPRGDADHNAWNNPDPKRSFTLAIAFAIQRGNIRMIQRAACGGETSIQQTQRSILQWTARRRLVGGDAITPSPRAVD